MPIATRFLPLFGRLLIAVIFIPSGYGKLMHPVATQAHIAAAGLPLPLMAYLVAVACELGGGILMVVGYQTRLAAFAMAVFTVAAGLGFHTDWADQSQYVNFVKNLAIAGGLLQIAAFGAGSLSLDALRRPRLKTQTA